MFVVHAPCAPDVREPNTFRLARLEPDLEEGSAEEEQRRGHRASQTPPTVQGVDLIARQIIHGNLRRTAALRQSEHLLLQAAGHIVTRTGSSGRWNPRMDRPRHEQIFGVLCEPVGMPITGCPGHLLRRFPRVCGSSLGSACPRYGRAREGERRAGRYRRNRGARRSCRYLPR
jgi:hypothetical protein